MELNGYPTVRRYKSRKKREFVLASVSIPSLVARAKARLSRGAVETTPMVGGWYDAFCNQI